MLFSLLLMKLKHGKSSLLVFVLKVKMVYEIHAIVNKLDVNQS